jgi:hypothetical protein
LPNIIINNPGSDGAGSIANKVLSGLGNVDMNGIVTAIAGLFFIKFIFGLFKK